jgi:hypothetical protein
MEGVNRSYAREMNERFGYLAAWLPNTQFRLGDVGALRGHIFEPSATLSELGVAVEVRDDPNAIDLDYTSSDSVAIELKASGEAAGEAKAAPALSGKISVAFKAADAVVFQASSCRVSRIANLSAVAEAVIALFEKGQWAADRVIVTEVVKARAATILISNSRDAHIDLSVQGGAAAGIPVLADANAGLAVTRAVGIGTRIIASQGLTPLFKARGVKQTWFGLGPAELRGVGATREQARAQLVDLDYKDAMGM